MEKRFVCACSFIHDSVENVANVATRMNAKKTRSKKSFVSLLIQFYMIQELAKNKFWIFKKIITAQDELMEEIENDFGIKGGENEKLEFTGMKSTNDKLKKKNKRIYRLTNF